MPPETRPWNVAEPLDTPERIAASIEAVLEDGDPGLVAAAIGDIARARARGMAQIASETGRSCESLYRTLSEGGNPQLATLMGARGARAATVREACRRSSGQKPEGGSEILPPPVGSG